MSWSEFAAIGAACVLTWAVCQLGSAVLDAFAQ